MTGIILASGKSSRMGSNKLLLAYKGLCLIEHTILAAQDSRLQRIILVAKDPAVLALGNKYPIDILVNEDADQGQSQSITKAIHQIPQDDGALFMVGDNPLIQAQTITALIELFYQSNAIIVPEHKGRHGNPVVFPNRYFSELAQLSGDSGGKKVLNAHQKDIVFFPADETVLFDVDTEEDYTKLIKGKY